MCREICRTSAPASSLFSFAHTPPPCPGPRGCRGRVGRTELTSDPLSWRATKSEIGFAVSLGALAYFWSVGRLNEGTTCDFYFFHSGKGEIGMIRDLWSGEHKQSPSLSPQAHMGCWIFPWLYIVETKANSLGIFPSFIQLDMLLMTAL